MCVCMGLHACMRLCMPVCVLSLTLCLRGYLCVCVCVRARWEKMPPLCDYLSIECLGEKNLRSAHVFGFGVCVMLCACVYVCVIV